MLMVAIDRIFDRPHQVSSEDLSHEAKHISRFQLYKANIADASVAEVRERRRRVG